MNTRKLTSRFGRGRAREAASLPEPLPSAAKTTLPEPLKPMPAIASDTASPDAKPEAEAATPVPEAAKPAVEAPAIEAAKPAQDPVAAKPAADFAAAKPAPTEAGKGLGRGSRLVEGERPAGKVALPKMKAWAASAASQAKPAAVPIAAAVLIALAMGIGYGVGVTGRAAEGDAASATRWLEAMSDLRVTHQEVAKLATELRTIRVSVESIKSERDKGRGELLSKQAQLSERLERSMQDSGTRMGRLSEQLERLDKTVRDPARLAGLAERLDKLERTTPAPAPTPTPPPKPVASAPATATGPAAAPDVAQTGSIAETKPVKPEPDPRKTQIEGYYVRDYDEGFALIETKGGRYIDVAVGYTVPGIGRVETIERRGRHWVVTTAKGYIAER